MPLRPRHVHQAIYRQDGVFVGRYGDYRLHSAFQKIFSMGEDPGVHEIVGFEGLVRPEYAGKFVSPFEFFLFLPKEDKLFVETMCLSLHTLNFQHLNKKGRLLFLNFDISNYDSERTLDREMKSLFSHLGAYGISRDAIVCEITETSAKAQRLVARMVKTMRDQHIKVAVDDFGNNHSTLARVRAVDPDIVKVDSAWFKKNLQTTMARRRMSELLKGFSDQNKALVLEGLETEKELDYARELPLAWLQGFVLARPQVITAILKEHKQQQKRSFLNIR